MTSPALNAAIFSTTSSPSWRRTMQRNELKKAIKYLERASRYGEIRFTLSDDQVRQIKEASKNGGHISLTVDFTNLK